MARRTPRQWMVYYLFYALLVVPWVLLVIFWILPRSHVAGYLVEAAAIFGALIGADKLERSRR